MHSLSLLAAALLPLSHSQLLIQQPPNQQQRVSVDYRYKADTLLNPPDGFSIFCGGVGSCEMAFVTINLDGTAMPPITTFEGFTFEGEASGKGATFVINNDAPNDVSIGAIECLGRESCVSATFITGYAVNIMRIDCAPGACDGCTVKLDSTSVGVPCTAGNPSGTAPAPLPPATPMNPNPIAPSQPSPVPATPINPNSPITATPLRNAREFVCSAAGSCVGATQRLIDPANGFYVHCGTRACSAARFEITIEADPQSVRGPIQGFYGFMFEGEKAGEGAVVSVSNEQAIVATDLGTIRCDGADACKDAQFIMGYQASITKVHCGAGACANCVVRTTPTSTPWPCDPTQPISNVQTPSNTPPPTQPNTPPSRPSTPSNPGGSGSFGPAAPGTNLVTGAQELKCEKIECQSARYRLDDSLDGLTVYCGDFEACVGSEFELNFGNGGVTRIEALECKAEASCVGAQFTVNNAQATEVINVERIICDASNACTDARFDLGFEVSLSAIECVSDACLGCTVVVGGVASPCDPLQTRTV